MLSNSPRTFPKRENLLIYYYYYLLLISQLLHEFLKKCIPVHIY